MRFLLLIPVFIMLLSNVPFIQVTPMEEMMAAMEKQEEKDCCKKNADKAPKSCQAEAACKAKPTACHSEVTSEAKPIACHRDAMPVKGSCQPSGANCICICVFQFAAPAQDLKLFQFVPVNILAGRTGYLQVKWKDPLIASPGQPPDWT
jgi:hypothetical protein